MNFFQFISIIITKKISAYALGLTMVSIVSLFVTGNVNNAFQLPTRQTEAEKRILAVVNQPMHEGVNNFIEITGWDGLDYKASISLSFFKKKDGTYQIKSPEFFMVQKSSGMAITYPCLNIKDSNSQKVSYTCRIVKNKDDSSFVNVIFNRCEGIHLQQNGQKNETSFIRFTTPEGNTWKAFIDSTYNKIGDTCALLKFKIEKG